MSATLTLASWMTITRLSLHVLAATIWVGGTLVLAGLIPTVRELGEGATIKVARAFGRMSWPAFWTLVATGVWSYLAVAHGSIAASWMIAFSVKMLCVLVAGYGAYRHTHATSPSARGLYAGISALGSILALVLGVALSG